jgi:hypothetical protein
LTAPPHRLVPLLLLKCEQLSVPALVFERLLMVLLFDHFALVQHNDFITFWNHHQRTMGNGGPPLSHLLDIIHDVHFGLTAQQR